MVYGFRDTNKSKVDLAVKRVSETGSFQDSGTAGTTYTKTVAVTVPDGYTPISAVVSCDQALQVSLRNYSGCRAELSMVSTGTIQIFQFTLYVYCVNSSLVEFVE